MNFSGCFGCALLYFAISIAFSQEAIIFQVPLDSIGHVEQQDLGIIDTQFDSYEIEEEVVKDIVKKEEKSSGSPFGWRGWTRIVAFTGTVVFGGFAIYKQKEANKHIANINSLRKRVPSEISTPKSHADWIESYEVSRKGVKDNETQRNIFGAFAGGFALAGIATFFF
jgi:hypothetical protein